jgi:N-acetylglucosamine-6-phosphate deacetylase
MLVIRHATVFTPEKRIDDGTLWVQGGRISRLGTSKELGCPLDAEEIDATNLFVVPGFIDLQVNGALGQDFTHTPMSIKEVAAWLPRYGVTTFLPTIISSLPDTVAAARRVLIEMEEAQLSGAIPLGLHLEGPFLNPKRRGVHDSDNLRLPDRDAVEGWRPENHVRLVTLAPELPGALEVVRILVSQGVVVGAGHSLANYDQALDAIQAGITFGTHVFNAMSPLHHRDPGLVGALLSSESVKLGVIVDGVHLHPVVVKFIWQIAGGERLVLVSDAMAGLGAPPGRYPLGAQMVTVDSGEARTANGTLAGSVLSIDAGLRNLMTFTGCALEEALLTVTRNPASLLGIDSRKGQIFPGADADLVLLTPSLEVAGTLVGGRLVYSNSLMRKGVQ